MIGPFVMDDRRPCAGEQNPQQAATIVELNWFQSAGTSRKHTQEDVWDLTELLVIVKCRGIV